jgi:ferredoxin
VSEAQLLWTLSALVVAAIVVPYAVAFRRRVAHDRERHAEARDLGIDRPPAQHPFIDPALCIGCGACVAACPEGDVLGIVTGTAAVINGLRCVGHGRCAEACPVGAIEVGLGDLASRADVPVLDPALESSVPGLFVAGELGGLALIRNAVEQGRRAMEEIASRCAAPSPPGTLDAVVVGAGPAGLAAALTAAERGLSYLLVEQEPDLGGTMLHYPRRKLVLTRRRTSSPSSRTSCAGTTSGCASAFASRR